MSNSFRLERKGHRDVLSTVPLAPSAPPPIPLPDRQHRTSCRHELWKVEESDFS
jgi:hypothetical protein